MRYRIAIVEDDPNSADAIKNYITRYSKETNTQFEFFLYRDGDEITSDYEAKYDIIFLDVEMRRLDGMSAAQKIREFDSDVIIIFITNMSQYAIKGYTVDALSFLLKPVPYFAFVQELKKSLDKIKKFKQKKYILIPDENGIKKISSNEILYIESIKHDLLIVTKDKSYRIRGTLKKMEEELERHDFNRSNNCYLVNLSYVDGVVDDFVMIRDEKLKISRPRKKQFMEELATYLGGKI
ncbi:LytR/AlgR family response regulator transcription factor [Haploplasma axanthum]|nr:LytTR family DNA-binding domain-containing protein [Haploplasma axanthum]